MATITPRVWLITGSSSGFGFSLACYALEKGDIVVATMRNPETEPKLAETYPEEIKDGKLLILKLDVTVTGDITSAFSTAKDKYGRIDVVFNNAGQTQSVGEVEQISDEEAQKLFNTNFWGAAAVSKEAVMCFRENTPPGGYLLQNSSGATLFPLPGAAYYVASKAAFEAFSESLSREVDPLWNIKITIIQPGPFNTRSVMDELAILPPHPAYTSPNLGTNISRAWMTPEKLAGVVGDVHKAAVVFYSITLMNQPPFRLPLHPRVVQRTKTRIEALQATLDECGSWSDDLL